MWCAISRPPQVRFGPAIRREDERDRTVGVEVHAHHRPETSLLDREALAAEHAAEPIVETVADLGPRCRREVGTAAVTGVGLQRELRAQQVRAAGVVDGERELPALVVEDARR